MKTRVSVFLLAFVIFSCSENSKSESGPTVNEPISEITKPLDSLSETEISSILNISSATQAGNYDGDSNEAIKDVIEIMKGSCGGPNCGMGVKFQNKAKRAFRITVEFQYETANEVIKTVYKEYVMNPSEVVEMGCTHICLNGEKVMVKREIVSSNYL